MHCLNCSYDLAALGTGICPECGRRFDPGDPRSFSSAGPAPVPHRFDRVAFWIIIVTALATPTLMHLTAFVASLVLGHWPIPSLNDPKDIPGLKPLLIPLTMLVLLFIPAVFCWGLFTGIRLVQTRAARPILWRAAAGAALLAAAFVLIRTDPWRVFEWFMD